MQLQLKMYYIDALRGVTKKWR